MNQSNAGIPEPSLPEHQLLQSIGGLPTLSSGLRDRVLVDCRRQLRSGRRYDMFRTWGTVLAASVLVCLIWNFRPHAAARSASTDDNVVNRQVPVAKDAAVTPGLPPESLSQQAHSAANPVVVPSGSGNVQREPVKEMQQINRLIDEIHRRQNALCGVFGFPQ